MIKILPWLEELDITNPLKGISNEDLHLIFDNLR